jgi:vesicular inhibitory amino acid transporter
MIVLFGDSLNTVFPHISVDRCMCVAFFLVLPTVFMPLSLLSVPSVFSSLATVLLVVIILFDGFWKTEAPGSIIDPMPTNWGPEMKGLNWLGGVGLILAGFGGHGVMPSIARDMKHPEAVDRIFNQAFSVAAAISMFSGGAGYLMMGDKVSDEVSTVLRME